MKKAYLLNESSGENGDHGNDIGITLNVQYAIKWKSLATMYESRSIKEYDLINSQPERLSPEALYDSEGILINPPCEICGLERWSSLHQGCDSPNTANK
jgi:hypothetical protein